MKYTDKETGTLMLGICLGIGSGLFFVTFGRIGEIMGVVVAIVFLILGFLIRR